MQTTTRQEGDYLHLTTQLQATYTPSEASRRLRKGQEVDNHLYLHQVVDTTTGEVLRSYVGPIYL